MGYKLADGSDSDLYRVGDTFQMVSMRHFKFDAGSVVTLTEDDKTYSPYFNGPTSIMWDKITPTEETKHKVAERSQPSNHEIGWLLSQGKAFTEVMKKIAKASGFDIDEEKLNEIKKAISQEPKCKCGYVIPVMEVAGGDSYSVEDMLSSVFNLGAKEPQHIPDLILPLARIIDWRNGEKVKPLDFVMLSSQYEDYRAVVMEVISPNEVRTCRGMVTLDRPTLGGSKFHVIRINTAAIPKQRTMTKAEVEREFGVKVVD